MTEQTTTDEVQCKKGDEAIIVQSKDDGDGHGEVDTESNVPVEADEEPVDAIATDHDDAAIHSPFITLSSTTLPKRPS